MIKPPVLRPGDRIAAVSLSWGGPSIFPHRYQAGKRQLEESLGVKVVEGRHAMADATWLAWHPEARASDLMEAFADASIRGIVSTIGRDDSIRPLPYIAALAFQLWQDRGRQHHSPVECHNGYNKQRTPAERLEARLGFLRAASVMAEGIAAGEPGSDQFRTSVEQVIRSLQFTTRGWTKQASASVSLVTHSRSFDPNIGVRVIQNRPADFV